MPELPEVEACRSLVARYAAGHRIDSVVVMEQGGGPRDGLFDEIVYEGGAAKPYEAALVGQRMLGMHRKGKQLWMAMEGKKGERESVNVLFHFGMTGSFVVKDKEKHTYKSFKIDDEGANGERVWPPRFAKMEIVFANGIRVAFCDPRRLGRIRIRRGDPTLVAPISELAPDPVLDGIDVEGFFAAGLAKASCPVKALLLDQNKLLCGVGNWVADEVLYQAGIHPSTPCNRLNKKGVAALARSITDVLTTAIACNERRTQFPAEWLFHYRWGGGPNSPIKKMPNGQCISFQTVGGRTSAIVLSQQPKSSKLTSKDLGEDFNEEEEQEQEGQAAADKGAQAPKKRKERSGSAGATEAAAGAKEKKAKKAKKVVAEASTRTSQRSKKAAAK